MRNELFTLPILVSFACMQGHLLFAQETASPHLEKRGAVTQLIVDGKPFLMLSGELTNSASSNLDHMKPLWPKLEAAGLNTVVTPLSWETIEPQEGSYDFTLVDGLIDQARQSHQKIVFLWFGSWKNGTSSYAPLWVKKDTQRFPREVANGRTIETLTPLGKATQDADAQAFAAVMQHIKQVDSHDHTVLMMQVENEIGVLGDSRDHSAEANRVFGSSVPAELTQYLKAHRDELDPDLRTLWDANGDKMSGTWTEVFNDSTRADETFMAWHYARYVHAIAAKGKAAYNIPMYVNTWLAERGSTPGEYPSGGPEPWVVDVWKAAGTAIDIYSPDLYSTFFVDWCQRYHRNGNPLYMPEAKGGALGAANVFYAVGEDAALGFSPFAIDMMPDENGPLAASYRVLAQIAPIILDHQTKGEVHGFVLDQDHQTANFTMAGYTVHVAMGGRAFGRPEGATPDPVGGLVIATGPNEFMGAGKGFRVTFTPRSGEQAGIGTIDEGKFEDGKWIPERRLNGDEDEGGKSWVFSGRQVSLEKIQLYKF
jgi:hypothetical protein